VTYYFEIYLAIGAAIALINCIWTGEWPTTPRDVGWVIAFIFGYPFYYSLLFWLWKPWLANILTGGFLASAVIYTMWSLFA